MCLWHLFENYPLSSNKQIVLSYAPSLRRPSNHEIVLLAIASNCTSYAVLSTNTTEIRISILYASSCRSALCVSFLFPNGECEAFCSLIWHSHCFAFFPRADEITQLGPIHCVCGYECSGISIAVIYGATHNAHVNTANYVHRACIDCTRQSAQHSTDWNRHVWATTKTNQWFCMAHRSSVAVN